MALCLVFGPDGIAWVEIASLLNRLARLQPITARIVQSAGQGVWLEKAGDMRPLPEDYSIRGLIGALATEGLVRLPTPLVIIVAIRVLFLQRSHLHGHTVPVRFTPRLFHNLIELSGPN